MQKETTKSKSPQKCSICGEKNHKLIFRAGNITRNSQLFYIVKCLNCGHIFVSPQPQPKELFSYYNKDYQVPLQKQKIKQIQKAKQIYQYLKKNGVNSGEILEIGCSYGFSLQFLKNKGFSVSGIELDQRAVEYAQKKLYLNVSDLNLDKYENSKKFDVIILFDVIEHLLQPDQALQKIHSLLKSQGILYMITPNINCLESRVTKSFWEWMIPPEHLHFFSPQTINLILEKNNFTEIKIKTTQGDASQPFYSLCKSLLNRFSYFVWQKNHNDTNKSLEKPKEDRLLRKIRRFIYTCTNFITYPLYLLGFPLFFLIRKIKLGPTIIVTAKKNRSS